MRLSGLAIRQFRNLGSQDLELPPDGVALIKRLVPHFDVVGENFKPGTMGRLGLGYEDLSALHPGLVYVALVAGALGLVEATVGRALLGARALAAIFQGAL